MKATYIDLVNRFWAENRRLPFSPCECALYFFLLNEANALRWEMPVAVPTSLVCHMTGMGKSTLTRAREALQQRGREFCPDILRDSISRVAKFLTTDSPKFGLMLMGLCGNGKTTLVKALQSILWRLDLRDDYGEKMQVSFYTAKALAKMHADADQSRCANAIRLPILAIDDLGNEPKQMMVYGNVVTPLTDILEIRYERRLFTIVTTNSTPEQIRADYGARIADRLNEMMETVIFSNSSFR